MRRYTNLNKEEMYEAFNRLRDCFLAAKDGNEVDNVIDVMLSGEEKLKIGRRILVAERLRKEETYEEIKRGLKVGLNTIIQVEKRMSNCPEGFEIIFRRKRKVEEDYGEKAYRKTGGPRLLHKKSEYIGFKRKDVER